jgi:hypothetical protein
LSLRALPIFIALGLLGSSFLACEQKRRPGYVTSRPSDPGGEGNLGGAPNPGTGSGARASGGGEECEELPPIDLSDLCEDTVSQVTVNKPNLYFLLDISGSMSEPIAASSGTSKIAASKQAILRVVEARGPRLNFGLAAFPYIRPSAPEEFCNAGRELFPLTPGDPLECGKLQTDGPVLESITERVLALRSGGGTPLSPSILALTPELVTQKGQTALLVLTDGAPNCNPSAKCSASECEPSVYGEYIGGIQCSLSVNCCDEDVVGTLLEDPGSYCFDDDDSIRRVADLNDAGVKTFIVGVPGANAFQDLMNRLAEAGGTARTGDTKYFDVGDAAELDEALDAISQEVALPCELELDPAPNGSALLNVYLDRELIRANSEDGWSFQDGKVTLLGESCSRVQKGEVGEVVVVEGCGTVLE